jgi:hypothetical protein
MFGDVLSDSAVSRAQRSVVVAGIFELLARTK